MSISDLENELVDWNLKCFYQENLLSRGQAKDEKNRRSSASWLARDVGTMRPGFKPPSPDSFLKPI